MSRAHANKEFWLAAMRTDGPAIRAVVAEADPDTPVPSCPDWTVSVLAGHLVRLYRWVASHVSRGVTAPPVGRIAARRPRRGRRAPRDPFRREAERHHAR